MGELGREFDLPAKCEAPYKSDAFIWRDMRFSARDVLPPRAECSGRGEPDDGGVSWLLPSRVASECCGVVSHVFEQYLSTRLTLLMLRLLALLYTLFLNTFACAPMRTLSPIFLMPISFNIA